ncbi:MAG TPA: response regulator transcription factor [Bryobacteraceae bacterium]|nr:response regulator transcription factor [Bryobacteraceae bacterium]
MPAAAPKIRVLIADDHAVLRAGLKLLVNSQPDMEVVGEAVNGRQAIERVRAAKPDVALLDLTMPGSGGMEALETLAEETAKVRIVILTMHDDPAYLRSVFAAGASGYVLKRSVDAELLSAIRAVGRGGTFIDPSLAGFLVRDAVGGAKAGAGRKRPAKLLSDRETQVLILVARGYSSQEIADQIFVSVKTVETYRARLAGKLGLRSRSDVVRYALQMGLLTPEAVQREQKHSA